MKTKDAIILADTLIHLLVAKGEIDREDKYYEAIEHLMNKAEFFKDAVEVEVDFYGGYFTHDGAPFYDNDHDIYAIPKESKK